MSLARSLLLLCLPVALAGCNSYSQASESGDAKLLETVKTFQSVERQVKSGISPARYPYLIAEANTAIDQLPADTPPRVVELLKGSTDAYTLAYKYWRCEQEPAGTEQAECRDGELNKVMAQFPRIKRNITRRLVLRPNPPEYLSASITPTNMLQLLIMQAELNRVDAHLILTGGKFDGVYAGTS